MNKMNIKACVYLLVLFILATSITTTSIYAGTFSDNFDDNIAEGWQSTPQGTFYGLGNWRVEEGTLIEDRGHDHQKFLIENYSFTDQSIESDIMFHDNGYAGITLWHQDVNNWVDVLIYPAGGILRVVESVDGILDRYDSPLTTSQLQWYSLKIDSTSSTGKLLVYLDSNLVGSHAAATSHRSGRSGLNSGNAGGSFDNFVITSTNIISTPQSKSECMKNGWKAFTNPIFKTQGACVSYVAKIK